jgi:ribose 5-phosphate isomerase B
MAQPSQSSAVSAYSVAIGGDDAAFELKKVIVDHLESRSFAVQDYGFNPTDEGFYPDIAYTVARAVADGKHERGIIICGTGIGVAITANKVPGIRAAVCHDPFSTERSRKSNNCQIMTLGARVIGSELAKTLVDIWMASEFQGGGSGPKVERMMEIEREIRAGTGDPNLREGRSC